jgi:hypothetical protein
MVRSGSNQFSQFSRWRSLSPGELGNWVDLAISFFSMLFKESGARVECPAWVGQTLFGHQDALISKRLPPAIELKRDEEQGLFDVVPALIPYIKKLADAKSLWIGSVANLIIKLS